MALTLILSKVPGLAYFEKIFNVMIDALPVIVATVAAKQVSGMGDVAIVAGVVTGILSVKGGLIGGIIGGILAGILVQFLLLKCLKLNFPATTANIVAGGIAGLAAGLLIYLFMLVLPTEKKSYSYLGERTMAIYIFHGFVYSCLKYGSSILTSVESNLECLYLLTFCFFLVWFLSRKPFVLFTNKIAHLF